MIVCSHTSDLSVDVPHIEVSDYRMSFKMKLEPKGAVRKRELHGRTEARYVVVCSHACSVHSVSNKLIIRRDI